MSTSAPAPAVQPDPDPARPSRIAGGRRRATAEETDDLARLAVATTFLVLVFAALGILMAVTSGEPRTLVGSSILIAMAGLMQVARRQLAERPEVSATLLLGAILVSVLALAAHPATGPNLATIPLLAIAIALAFLEGRRLAIALVAAWTVATVAAAMIALQPAARGVAGPFGVGLAIIATGAVVAFVGYVLYRGQARLRRATAASAAAADALRESEVRYRSVVEGVREVIFRIDAEGRWVLLNRAWEEVTGHPVRESLGRRVLDFVHPDDRERQAELVQPVLDGDAPELRHELRVVAADGREVWVDAHARALRDDDGRYVGLSGTLTDVTLRRELEDRLRRQAFHDPLTGLANRALFKDRVEHALDRRPSSAGLVALMFLDLDRFKTVNDSLGHTTGDRLLVAIAQRLRHVLRPVDTIARLGGDEFGILVEDVQARPDVVNLARRITAAFDDPFELPKRAISVRASLGVVMAAVGHRNAEDLLRDADVAMYRAKVGRRGSYTLFEPAMQVEVATRLDLESDLRTAIEQEAVDVAYQPIVDLRDGRIAGVEALARWHHSVRGDVPPSVFIPSAEESGLIFPLGGLVLRRACLDLARLRRSTPAARRLRVSVNVSPRQLVDAGIVDEIREALRVAGLPASALVIEVTEGLMFEGGPDTNRVLETLREDGCRVSLDDFGTGFSSLGNLRSLPIDELKIDRSFVSAMPAGTVNAVIAEAVVRLGGALEVDVVAEGIEDAATADRLAALGCPFGQGYHFGRSAPIEALEARLAAPAGSLGAA